MAIGSTPVCLLGLVDLHVLQADTTRVSIFLSFEKTILLPGYYGVCYILTRFFLGEGALKV